MITGNTELCCLLADPVGHVRTPQIFNTYLAERDVDAVVVPLNVARDDLCGVVAGLRVTKNLRAIIVTIPHKIAIRDLCDDLEESARTVGAVNIIRREDDGRLVGANFDGRGFVAALEAAVGSIAGRSVFMAGAGGVARAIAFEIARAGASRLALHNRSPAKGEALAREVAHGFSGVVVAVSPSASGECDIAINATSLGLHPEDPLPFPVTALPDGAIVAEVVMQPLMTPLLQAARARGLRVVTGDGMLGAQLPFWMDFLGFHSPVGSTSASRIKTALPL